MTITLDSSSLTAGAFSPIKGMRIIDCTNFVAAPMAATILSDFGADVIKVEPFAGDFWRQMLVPGTNLTTWDLTSRNKRGLALDLKHQDSEAIMIALIKSADVFITNFPRDTRGTLKITNRLMELNPRLVYASFTAYGETGPDANKPGFDYTAFWAAAGLMDMVRDTMETPAVRPTSAMGDQVSSLALSQAITMGLWQRDKTGKGTEVGSSLLACGLWANAVTIQGHLDDPTLKLRPPDTREKLPDAFRVTHKLADGTPIILTGNTDKEQRTALTAIGLSNLLEDSRFNTVEARKANAGELESQMAFAFSGIKPAQWSEIAETNGIKFEKAHTTRAAADNPQAREAGAIVRYADGSGETVSSPINIAGIEKVAPRRGPAIGQHTREILAELSYTNSQIDRLIANKVVSAMHPHP